MVQIRSNDSYITEGRFLLQKDRHTIKEYLVTKGWLSSDEHIKRIEKPGEGNMNLVLRVIPRNAASFILKQARPWVEKYPDIEAPVERIQVEYQYYRYIHKYRALATVSPTILGFDKENSVLLMEDLGDAVDYTGIYHKKNLFSYQELEAAISYLNQLKSIPIPQRYPSNLTLRKLNHQHIFQLPFSENQFNLDCIQPGLQKLSEGCKQDRDLIHQVKQLGTTYLIKGEFLQHGDFYPGSMLSTSEGLKVIDPEFSFIGPEEWDLAIFIAHLFLSNTSSELINEAYCMFIKTNAFSQIRLAGYAGTEILRRLLGLAQLPLELTLDQRKQLIEHSISWIKTGKIHTLSCYENYTVTS